MKYFSCILPITMRKLSGKLEKMRFLAHFWAILSYIDFGVSNQKHPLAASIFKLLCIKNDFKKGSTFYNLVRNLLYSYVVTWSWSFRRLYYTPSTMCNVISFKLLLSHFSRKCSKTTFFLIIS